eukprot:573630-Hanusia_phi.AAC.1
MATVTDLNMLLSEHTASDPCASRRVVNPAPCSLLLLLCDRYNRGAGSERRSLNVVAADCVGSSFYLPLLSEHLD